MRCPTTDANNDTLTYSLSGTDAGSFAIGSSTGQITVGTGTALDYETKNSYEVTVSVTDGVNVDGDPDTTVDDTIDVTISVTNVDEAPVLSGLETVSYAENGTGSVATYTAVDPESATLTWTLSGDDAGDFSISSSGELTFSSSPDYENAQDANTDNEYLVTVEVSDGTTGQVTQDVTISVTNVDETGAVDFDADQPRVDAALTATLTDPDGTVSGESWQWASSSDQNTWADISGATTASYTPVSGDVGNYLRATVSYTDPQGSGKSAQGETANAVQAASVTNNAPAFDSGESVTLSVDENTAADGNVGSAVSATDANNDTLIYSLSGTGAGSFAIGSSTGQITVGTGTTLDYETRNSYEVTVSVHDGMGGSDAITVTVTVTINVTDVDEPPPAPSAPTVSPPSASGHTSLTVSWSAPSNAGPPITDYDLRWSLKDQDSWTEITDTDISATTATISGLSASTEYDVQVRATNDEGTGPWSDAGTGTTGTLVEVEEVIFDSSPDHDDTYQLYETVYLAMILDGPVSVTGSPQLALEIGSFTRQAVFYNASHIAWVMNEEEELVPGKTYMSFEYLVQESDIDADGISIGANALTLNGGTIRGADNVDAVLTIPADQTVSNDAKHMVDGSQSVAPSVVGVTITSSPESEETYSIGETIEVTVRFSKMVAAYGSVRLRLSVGQTGRWANKVAWTGEEFPTEVVFRYVVGHGDVDGDGISIGADALDLNGGSVRVADSVGDAQLTITKYHVISNDAAHKVLGQNEAPQVAGSIGSITLTEGGSSRSVSLSDKFSGPDGDELTYSAASSRTSVVRTRITGSTLTLTPVGPGTARITVTVRDPDGAEAQQSFTVRVSGTTPPPSGGGGGGTPSNRAPVFNEGTSAIRDVAENTAAGQNIGDRLAAVDPDGDSLTYTLSGADASSFQIDRNSGQLRTKSALDYEAKSSYRVTATLSDPDGTISGISWVWASSPDGGEGSWSDIGGATSASYTPVAADVDSHLRATASYTDGEGPGKSAASPSTHTVRSATPDGAAASLSFSATNLTVSEGSAATYTVALGTEPSATVIVSLESSDGGAATVSPESLTFTRTNWGTPQTVTVRGVNDPDRSDERVTITHSTLGGDYGGVTGTVTVNVGDTDPDDRDQIVPVPNTVVVSPDVETAITSPDGNATLTFPVDSRGDTFQVSMDTSLDNCTASNPPEGTVHVCVSVEIFDAGGNREESTALDEAATLEFRLSPEEVEELGGQEALREANEEGSVRFLVGVCSTDHRDAFGKLNGPSGVRPTLNFQSCHTRACHHCQPMSVHLRLRLAATGGTL